MIGRPAAFDFNGPMPPPDYLVDGLVERGTITVLSADSGVGKSLITASIAVAMMQNKPWLGRKTNGTRCMVVDEENFYRVIHGRLKALGMTNEDRPNLRYFLRMGVQLGASDWLERVQAETGHFKPDMLVIDTAAAATNVELNDNTAVAKLYASAIRPLADETAVLLLHHERKPAQGQKRHAGHAMMGARQWAGQADAHLALERLGDMEIERRTDGSIRQRYPLKLEMPKNRDGRGVAEKIVIVSEHEGEGALAHRTRVERVKDGH